MTSILKVNQIQNTAGGVPTAAELGLNVTGSVLQVQYTQFTGTVSQAMSANTDTAFTDLTVSITPTATSSKILLQTHVFFEGGINDHDFVWMFFRDSTVLKAPVVGSRRSSISAGSTSYFNSDSNSTPTTAVYQYFDTPASTNTLTYKVGANASSATTMYINRSVADTDSIGYERGISYISATEIAG